MTPKMTKQIDADVAGTVAKVKGRSATWSVAATSSTGSPRRRCPVDEAVSG
jgi:hypothetical protein